MYTILSIILWKKNFFKDIFLDEDLSVNLNDIYD